MLGRSKRPVANCHDLPRRRDAHDPATCGHLTCHGFYAATTDPAPHRRDRRRRPATASSPSGPAPSPGSLVVDVDPAHGGDASLADLMAARLLPRTLWVRTGSGGQHLYYRHPGQRVPSRPMPGRPGIDIKADGGYVVLPPSIHHRTRRPYRWGRAADDVAEMPPALVTACLPADAGHFVDPADHAQPRPQPGGGISHPDSSSTPTSTPYATHPRAGAEPPSTAPPEASPGWSPPEPSARADADRRPDRRRAASRADRPRHPRRHRRRFPRRRDRRMTTHRPTTTRPTPSTAPSCWTTSPPPSPATSSCPARPRSVAVVLWIAATHAVPAWNCAPRLVIRAPEKRCGKSRLLDMVEAMCHRPLMTVNASPSAVYRSIGLAPTDPPTLLIDEADTIFGPKAGDNEDLRGLLNAGHQRGRPALRYDASSRSVEKIQTFAMAALAGIGAMPDTIEDRAAVDPDAPPRARRDGRSRTGCSRDGPALAELRAAAHTSGSPPTSTSCAHAAPDMPLEDRAADTWEPLIAVADLAGGDWPAHGPASRPGDAGRPRGLRRRPAQDPAADGLPHRDR